jgi:hypoxanthine phosphoribosyltransferase
MAREAIILGETINALAVQDGQSKESASPGPEAAEQQLLPPLRWLMQPDDSRFAHPAETHLSHLLTFYGIRWSYEPTTFAVRWGPHGEPLQFVTPDFFLPDHGCYLELTTMRQRLVTRKNRKFRLLRQHYPNVNVRILYLRDFERLCRTYGHILSQSHPVLGEVVYDGDQLGHRIEELAADYGDLWANKGAEERAVRPLLLGLGRGSRTFLEALSGQVRTNGVPVDHDSIILSTPDGPESTRRVRVERAPRASVTNRPVTVVQEVLSSGLSAAYVTAWLVRHGATSVDICTLLDRDVARILDVPVALRGFSAPDVTLAGFGLSRWGEFRDLPHVSEVLAQNV